MSDAKQVALDWVDRNAAELSAWTTTIWDFAEPAFREYRSAAWYVKTLQDEGFTVEAGSGGMPTAFCATYTTGPGPTVATYAEYDAVPGNCQAATTREEPRPGLSRHAAGHTDPHSALGMSALGGALAAKAAMDVVGLGGTLKVFGEPAEKLRASKPIHAAKGYYDALDAAVSYHPHWALPLCNTVVWDTHCGVGFNYVYAFRCDDAGAWLADGDGGRPQNPHYASRAPGATDALLLFLQLNESLRRSMLPMSGFWSFNEAILTTGQATADNLVPQLAEVDYMVRTDTLDEAEAISRVMDSNAEAAAKAGFCTWEKIWVAKSRAGIPNHALSRAAYANLERVGAPVWGDDAVQVAREIQANLGLDPMERPFQPETERVHDPEEIERERRLALPVGQRHLSSDDYTEYTWHCPTARLYVARPALVAPPGYRYPAWVANALGGIPATIDPSVRVAAKTIGATLVDLLADGELLAAAQAEFRERTGGGIGGARWEPPMLPADFRPPVELRWPEYITTARGEEWWIPTRADDRARATP
jgi:aminobenzoyl-glutamate utilization protein B